MSTLPTGWNLEPFSQVATYSTGRTPARANDLYWKSDVNKVPWVAISDMEAFGKITETSECVSGTAFNDVFKGRVVPAGTLLMSFKLTIGRVATLGIPACHNEAIISIYPRKGVDQRFLGYYLSQVDYSDHQDRQVKGNTLNQAKIDRIPILLPPTHEQKSIADVLDRCREAINTELLLEKTTQELKQSTMRELFTRGLNGEVQKETEIGFIPKSWEVSRLDDIAKTISTRMSYSELLEENHSSIGGFRVLGVKVSDMNRDGNELLILNAALERTLSKETAEYRCAPPNTIIFPKRGAAIATNKKRLTTTWTVFDPNVIGVIPTSIDSEFLFHWFQNFDLRTITEPGPTPQLNKKHLDPLLIPVPSTLKEQQDIAALFNSIDKKISLHRNKSTILEELFKSLLNKLMSGEIRINELDLTALETTASSEASV